MSMWSAVMPLFSNALFLHLWRISSVLSLGKMIPAIHLHQRNLRKEMVPLMDTSVLWASTNPIQFWAPYQYSNIDNFTVVTQYFEAEVVSEYVIRGNTAVLKCNIPSFVADFVKVEAWVDSDGGEYLYSDDIGTHLRRYVIRSIPLIPILITSRNLATDSTML